MADSWESDPLFSAAEVVQDSADRMESVYRMLLHDQSLVQGGSLDSKLLSLIQYHRRDLLTALETTKWQLEDFERAVDFAALSDTSNLRHNAILKHKQFTRAIREQIGQVEKDVALSMSDFNRNSKWGSLNEQDRDGLASFLAGGDSSSYHTHDSGRSIMRRFLNSNMESDEIVELSPEESDLVKMNGPKHYSETFVLGAPNYLQGCPTRVHNADANNIFEDCDLEAGDASNKCYAYRNRSVDSFGRFFRKYWIANEHTRSHTKRRKDGEVTDDLLVNVRGKVPSSIANPSPLVQDHVLMGWASVLTNCRALNLSCLNMYSLLEALQMKLQRSPYPILHNQFSVQLMSAILVILVVLGIVAFYVV